MKISIIFEIFLIFCQKLINSAPNINLAIWHLQYLLLSLYQYRMATREVKLILFFVAVSLETKSYWMRGRIY
jgi:hypothetical protein